MIKIKNEFFSIKDIWNSGQCFRMHPIGEDKYRVVVKGKCLEMEETQGEVALFCTKEEFQNVWEDYFDLKEDYSVFFQNVSKEDRYLQRAASFGKGIRILKQDLWEMIISFIISTQNNIKRIRKCIDLLCKTYGKEIQEGIYAFPEPEELKNVTEEELRGLGLGYRSKYIVKTTQLIIRQEVSLEEIKRMDYQEAKKELQKLTGVGEKVADCVCLFGLHHFDAFPVDTHINQVLEREYGNQFPYEIYKGYRGVIQQYIFYYDFMRENH